MFIPFLLRFVDRDGDGCITADDLFAAQAQVMQKNEAFIKVRDVFLYFCIHKVAMSRLAGKYWIFT